MKSCAMQVTMLLERYSDKGKIRIQAIYYTGRTLDDEQINYSTIKKEFLAVVFVIDNSDPISLHQKSLYTQTMLLSGTF